MQSFLKIAMIASVLAISAGCQRKTKGPWDDAKSASTIHKKNDLPWGDGESDQLAGPSAEEFIPLQEEDLKAQLAADGAIPQSSLSPGEEGSGIPSLDQFQAPLGELSAIFQTVYFQTDDHILRGEQYLSLVQKMAVYMKEHPEIYLSIAGHCDERGPEAYNMSLGARRANYIRSLLIAKGVDLNRIFTVSHGKEHPVAMEHTPQAWSKNRRAEFKLHKSR
jgi:peptidoglycan-associated lipoprotein